MVIWVLCGCTSDQSASSDTDGLNELAEATVLFSENSTVFEIIPVESEARFLVDEILRGEETTVIGKTSAVSGQIAVDFNDPSASAAGPVHVNALTLETDNAFRNRAIRTRILLAMIYEFVVFTPTAISGIPNNIVIGEPVTFQIEGDLTIIANTKPVTFAVTVIPVSETRLEGHASATINRTDFDLVIPSAAGVAGVDELVILELDFVATAGEK